MSAADHLHPTLFPAEKYHTGDPWAMTPERWMAGEHGPITWHSTERSSLPRMDRSANDPFVSVGYGSAVGMHFGTVNAGLERLTSGGLRRRNDPMYSHPVRIPTDKIKNPHPKYSAQNYEEGEYRTGVGRPDLWSDMAVNYEDQATKAVNAGKVLPYENSNEDPGSTSYRALPQIMKTWHEDVLESPTAHPGLKEMASQFKVVQNSDDYEDLGDMHHQPSLFDNRAKSNADFTHIPFERMEQRKAAIRSGEHWKMANRF